MNILNIVAAFLVGVIFRDIGADKDIKKWKDEYKYQLQKNKQLHNEIAFFHSLHESPDDPKGIMKTVYPPILTHANKLYAAHLKQIRKDSHIT